MAAQKKIEIIATENVSEKINKAKEAIDKIGNSAMPVRKQMRELQKVMMEMNLDGLSNTDVFTEAAQRAGQLKDAMADAQQAVAAYANDTFSLKAAGEVFTGIAAAGSVATGVMGLFGTENEHVKEILLKVQSAQAILNGVTAISNVLNKDSAIMLKLKQIRMKAVQTTTTGATVATNANTVANTLNNAATKQGTVVQTAWNTAKAIGKAMVGDFTGLLLLGIGAAVTYAAATADSTDKINDNTSALGENKKALEVIQDAESTYTSTAASTYANLMKTYDDLRDAWNKLKSAKEKNEFLKDNKKKIEELTTAVNDVDSAEKVFNDRTGTVVKAFKLRAQAAAAAAVQVEMYKKAMEAEMNLKFGMRGAELGQDAYNRIPENLRNQLQVVQTERRVVGTKYTPTPDGGYRSNEYAEVPVRWKVPDNATAELLEAMRRAGLASSNAMTEYRKAMELAEEADKKSEDLLAQANALLAEGKKTGGSGSGGSNTNNNKDTYEKDKAALQQQYNTGVLTELEYKEKIFNLEKSHFEALLKSNKATKEDAQRYINAKKEVEQYKIQLQYNESMQQAQTELNQGVITQQEYLEKIASIQKSIYDANLKNGTATQELADAYKQAKKAADDFGKTSLQKLNEQLQQVEAQLENDNLTAEVKLQLINKVNELQQQIDKLSNHDNLTIPAKVEPKYIVKGSMEDLRQSTQNAYSMINDIADDYDLGLIDYNTATKRISDINKQLVALGAKPYMIEIESTFGKELQSFMDGAGKFDNIFGSIDGCVSAFDRLNDAVKEGKSGWEQFMAAVNATMAVLNAISTVMTIIDAIQTASNITTGVTNTMKAKEAAVRTANSTAQGVEQGSLTALATTETAAIVPTIALATAVKKLAAANIFLAHSEIPFVGPPAAAAGVATMEATLAAISAFANGGIVSGRLGDYNIARVSDGEMILNNRQQRNLFNMIDKNRANNEVNVVGGEIKFRGTDFYLMLKNLDKKKNMIR